MSRVKTRDTVLRRINKMGQRLVYFFLIQVPGCGDDACNDDGGNGTQNQGIYNTYYAQNHTETG
jgi:hypothetical protein